MDGRKPAVNGTETRLDLLIDEITALRVLLTPAAPSEPIDGETVELREPKNVKRRPLPDDAVLLGKKTPG